MRSKKNHFSGIIPMLALGMIFVLSACEDNKDLYNPERVQEEAKKAFPVKDIDPNQTWETSAVCNASVSVNEKDGETYTIKVYTSNPYNVNSSDVFLLAKTTVANGKTVNFKFDIPAALQYVYVMKVNSEGYSSAVPVAVTDGSMNVTFGGRTETRMATTRGAITRGSTWEPTKLSKAPEGTVDFPTDGYTDLKPGGDYYLPATTTVINIGVPVNLYIKDNVTISQIYIKPDGGQPRIYILPGASLTYPAGDFNSKVEINICEGASLYSNDITLNSINLYNCGTINANNLSANANNNQYSNLINEGDIKLKEELRWTNRDCILVNRKNIFANCFSLEGSSQFFNESTGKVEMTGLSHITSNSSVWVNEGYFKTNRMEFVSQGGDWINKCKLYVENDLTITTSSAKFIMDAGSYAECQDFDMDMSRIEMGSGSFFNVKGTASLKWNENSNGFHATGTEYALLKMNKAIPFGNNIANVHQTYSGKLYVACSDHFEIGGGWWYYQLINDAEMTGADNADIEIPHSQCNPGYKGTADEDKDDDDDDSDDKYPLLSYAYAFEDMTKEALTDYDFNDVVLYVTTPYKKGGQNVVDVTLKAAGASKQLTVFFKDLYSGTSPVAQNIFGEKGGEVHTVFGVEPGILINTGIPADTEAKIATKESVTVTVKVSDGFSITEHGDFYIVDEKGKEVHIPNFTPGFKKGNVPYAIRVASTTWKWAKERVSITEAYKGFEEWAQDAMKEPTWYDSPVSGNVY